ncbi:MAG: extracellular solute-binding protein [Streptosporangiaceae bacterium]|jgi:raffinose/stachyose/melibiose transport system substrate-binding protein
MRGNRPYPRNRYFAIALAAATAITLAACGSSGGSSPPSSTGKVTITWWHNGSTNPLRTVWQQVADAYHASNPKVSFSISPIQSNDFATKIPLALDSGNPPDIYQQWGGGQEATQQKSGKLADLGTYDQSWISEIGTAAANWQVNGQQYGVPYDLHIVGFWYRKDLFAKAGISSPPTTIAELESDDALLKAHGITPIAVGSKDKWPDAFWWEYFALRECSPSVIKQAMTSMNLSASCFSKASTDLTAFMKTNPFQTGFLGTASQVGAGSSAGMVGSGKAAMELQGDWELGVIDGLEGNDNANADLGWFPFPAVTGGSGDQTALLGGGDGFSCTTGAAEPACANFLGYIDSKPVQEKLVEQGDVGLPANNAAAVVLTDPALKSVVQARASASYLQTYFDIALPTAQGQNLDSAIANFFAGQGTNQQIISSVSTP